MMKKTPVQRHARSPITIDEGDDAIVSAARKNTAAFSFRYSSTEISVSATNTHVKARHARFEDGKLTTETFEGDFDRGIYGLWVDQTRRAVSNQTSLFFKSLGWFLPFSRKPRGGRD